MGGFQEAHYPLSKEVVTNPKPTFCRLPKNPRNPKPYCKPETLNPTKKKAWGFCRSTLSKKKWIL